MVKMFTSIFLFILLVNILLLLFKLNHLLKLMLVFEFIGLNMVFLSILFFYKKMIFLVLIFLVLLACEASVGLSLLVGVVRLSYMYHVENYNIFII